MSYASCNSAVLEGQSGLALRVDQYGVTNDYQLDLPLRTGVFSSDEKTSQQITTVFQTRPLILPN